MHYLLVRQQFSDFGTWRAAFDSLLDQRSASGIHPVVVARNADDAFEAVVLLEVSDADRVRDYLGSDALQQAHQRAGVIEGTTRITVMETADIGASER